MLSVGNDAKTVKGLKLGILTGILYLAPVLIAGRKNVCPFASKGCKAACLYSAGRGAFNSVQEARINKTRLFYDDRQAFFSSVCKAIGALDRKASRMGLTPAVRLNGTSDLPWESLRDPSVNMCNNGPKHGRTLLTMFSGIQFYDYTKSLKRATRWAMGRENKRFHYAFPANYHLTFSRSETNENGCKQVLNLGGTVAVVFAGPDNDKKALPDTWFGFPVISGDDTDYRPGDPAGHVIGLTAKGKARHDTSGFVVQFGDASCDGAWQVISNNSKG